jgi:hypothetical protein
MANANPVPCVGLEPVLLIARPTAHLIVTNDKLLFQLSIGPIETA